MFYADFSKRKLRPIDNIYKRVGVCVQLLEISVTEQEWQWMKNTFFDFPRLYLFHTRFFRQIA